MDIAVLSMSLIFLSVFSGVYYFYSTREAKKVHLPEEYITPEEKEQQGRSGLATGLRAITPVTQKVVRYFPFIGRESTIRRKLASAGYPLTVLEFLTFKILCLILVPICALIIFREKFNMMFLPVALLVGYAIADVWLNRKARKRQYQISRDLPNIIDLLNLCVSAGMDFMLAVNRTVRDFKKCPLTEELHELWRENQMGKPRRDALKNLAWRVDLPEMSSFVRTLIQADRMGSPVADALKIQAEEIRIRRFQRGEEMALKAPLKLLIPLLFFILPVVAVVVGGPVILQFLRGGIGTGV